MKKNEEAVNLPQEPEEIASNNPAEVCRVIQTRMISFITDIEKVIRHPSIKNDLDFLDKLAKDIIALEHLSSCTSCCSENIIEAGKLIHNLITDEITINDKQVTSTNTLALAKEYLKEKKTSKIFSTMLSNFLKDKETTKTFINQLKVLAFDINSELK